MVDVSNCIRTLRVHIEDFDIESRLRLLKRQPPRRLFVFVCIFLFLLYVFTASDDVEGTSTVQQCVNDRLRHWSNKFDDLDIGIDHSAVNFVGNGYIGVDSSGELRFSSNGSRVLDMLTGFYPTVNSKPDGTGTYEHSESVLTDFQSGVVKTVKCFLVEKECACVQHTRYAHRTRKNVIVEEVQLVNPTKTTFNLNIDRNQPVQGWKNDTMMGGVVVHSRTMKSSSGELSSAVMCSNTPGKVAVMQKREETFIFTCVVFASGLSLEKNEDVKTLSTKVVQAFTEMKSISSMTLAQEHHDAWKRLNSISFSLSHSKAPSVLNGDRINATRYLLLSNVAAPTMEVEVSESVKKSLNELSLKNERCYDKPSTLHYPSRLWQEWDKPADLVKLADLWLLTLEKRGCSNFIKIGAEGVAQAFVLSLTANSFHDGHLEMDMAASDLHREMSFGGIPIGGGGATVFVRVIIETDNRPYLEVSSSEALFACDGGCLDEPVTLAKKFVRLPIKVTKPPTSILYVATSRKHLELLRSTIHVSEVGAAPAHEEEVLSLHRHGANMGGMPTSFWVFLGIILIAFHVFLAKLLWSEWRKGDMTPYNPYLRNRYSYVRSH